MTNSIDDELEEFSRSFRDALKGRRGLIIMVVEDPTKVKGVETRTHINRPDYDGRVNGFPDMRPFAYETAEFWDSLRDVVLSPDPKRQLS